MAVGGIFATAYQAGADTKIGGGSPELNQGETVTDYQKFLAERIKELSEKIKNGDTEETYQIGAQSFTEKEWDAFLKKFDAVEKAMQQNHSLKDTQNIRDTESMRDTENVECTDTDTVDAYVKYLSDRYGVNVTVRSVGRDRESLDKAGKSMSGNDVIIAPNILKEMADNREKAAYYEKKIQDFFDDIPRQSALCAAKGLVYEPCGVVIHEDGTVTYISGCSDSPERVAEVNAINKAKREKEAARRKAGFKRRQEEMDRLRALMELQSQGQAMIWILNNGGITTTESYSFLYN